MNIEYIPYDNHLKKLKLQDITFNLVLLEEIPKPYYKDYSHHKSEKARNYKSYDTSGFRDILLMELTNDLKSNVLKLFIITPKNAGLPYDAFAYLSNKTIVGLRFENKGNFKLWMDLIFEKNIMNLRNIREMVNLKDNLNLTLIRSLCSF